MSVLIGLSPFVVFFVLMRLVSPVAGLTGALVVSALLVLRMRLRRESIKILEVGSFVLFAALTVYTLVAAPQWTVATVRLFSALSTHYVLGNWDGDWITGVNSGWAPPAPDGRKRDASRLRRAIEEASAKLHEPWGDLELGGRHIAWIHGNDRPLLKELEQSDCYDYLFYGHTHVAEQHLVGSTLVLNPGALFRATPHMLATVEVPDLTVNHVQVPNE